jgi:hypothetical protein
MWRDGFLYRIDAEVISVVLCVAVGAAGLAGYRVALRSLAGKSKPESVSDIGPLEAAITGLLALVLALSFTIASQRFDARQAVIVNQTNAIGTAFLRCSVLDSDERTYCETQLRAYVDLFVAYGEATHEEDEISAILHETEAIERALWARLAAVARERPTVVNATVITALNNVIDRRGDRIASMRIVVPQQVTAVLLLLCVVWGAVSGYAYGLKRNPQRAVWIVFSMLVAVVIYVTLDFDRPRQGHIRLDAGNQSMVDLQQTLRSSASP